MERWTAAFHEGGGVRGAGVHHPQEAQPPFLRNNLGGTGPLLHSGALYTGHLQFMTGHQIRTVKSCNTCFPADFLMTCMVDTATSAVLCALPWGKEGDEDRLCH